MEKVYVNDIIRISKNVCNKSTYHEDIQIYLDLNTGVEYLFAKHWNGDQLCSQGAGGMTVRYKPDKSIWVLSTDEIKDACKRYVEAQGKPDTDYYFYINDDKHTTSEKLAYIEFIIKN